MNLNNVFYVLLIQSFLIYNQRMAVEGFTQVLSKSQKQNLKKQVIGKPYQTRARKMDCLTDLGIEAVKKLGELVVVSSMKHFKYLTQHKTITTNLEEKLKNLKMMKQALQTRVNIESRKGHEIEPTVLKWLSDVTTIEDQLQKWLSDEKFNYSSGKQTTKNIEYITSLKEEKYKFNNISYPLSKKNNISYPTVQSK